MTPDDLGRLAFEAYLSQGDSPWPWEDLNPSARERWVRCGEAVDRASRTPVETALHRLQALGKHWVTVAAAPMGKYSGPAVLAAARAFHAELESGGSQRNDHREET